MKLAPARLVPIEDKDQHQVRFALERASGRAEFFFRSQEIALHPNNEAFVAAALTACMFTGHDIQLQGSMSRRLLDSIPTITHMFQTWSPHLRRITVSGAEPVERQPAQGGRVGVFFSLGVDSFFTLMRRREEITDLIHIVGYFERLGRVGPASWDVQPLLQSVADALGKRLIIVHTDLRRLYDRPGIHWNNHGYGPTMAAVGHVLYPEFKRVYIASGHDWTMLLPSASHPLLDPLWSSEGLEVVHDGLEFSRLDKLQLLANEDLVTQALRVCSRRPPSQRNCGQCEKCIRTMIGLLMAGSTAPSAAFDTPLDPARVVRMQLPSPILIQIATRNLRDLEAAGRWPELTASLRRALRRARWREAAWQLLETSLPPVYHLLRRIRRVTHVHWDERGRSVGEMVRLFFSRHGVGGEP